MTMCPVVLSRKSRQVVQHEPLKVANSAPLDLLFLLGFALTLCSILPPLSGGRQTGVEFAATLLALEESRRQGRERGRAIAEAHRSEDETHTLAADSNDQTLADDFKVLRGFCLESTSERKRPELALCAANPSDMHAP